MRLALNYGWVGLNPRDTLRPDHSGPAFLGMVREAERVGFDAVWAPEAYGADAFSVCAWLAAHTERIHVGTGVVPVQSRSTEGTARAAKSLDLVSGGRARVGIGCSGPQVVEGWHGQPYRAPLRQTREAVAAMRAALHDSVPVYLGAMGPRNLELAAEVADGVLVTFFSPYQPDVVLPHLEAGRARRPPGMRPFDFAPHAPCFVGDLEDCLAAAKQLIGFFAGGMGAVGTNYYNDILRRLGYEEAAERVQELFLSYRRAAAFAALPDALVDEVSLLGPPERVRDRLAAWRECGVTTLVATTNQPEALRALANVLAEAA